MKASNWIVKLRGLATNSSQAQQLKFIYVCAIIGLFLLAIVFKPTSQPDTGSYFLAGEKLFSGSLDVLRTPVYPFICHIVDILAPSHHYITLTIIQSVVFLISVFCFYKTSTSLMERRAVAFWCSLFYALSPAISTWVLLSITESLSCSFVVIFFYYLVESTEHPSLLNSIGQVAMLLLVLFIRPSFIYVIPLAVIYWTYLLVKKRDAKTLVNFAGILLCLSAYLIYCNAFKRQYKVFATSSVSTVNVCMRLVNEPQLLETKAVNNAEMQTYIANNIDTCRYAWQIYHLSNRFIDRYGLDNFNKIIRETVSKHKKEIARIYIEGMVTAAKSSVFTYEWMKPYESTIQASLFRPARFLFCLPNITCGTLLLILAAYAFFLLKRMASERRIFALSSFTWCMAFGGILTVIIGADADYSRLCVPSLPFVTLTLFKAFDAFGIISRHCKFK